MISSGLPDWLTFSRSGTSSRRLLIFFSWIRMKASSSTQSISAGRLMKYGEMIALVELHAFDELQRGLGALAFFDGDDAVLADLLHRVGQQVADRRSLLALIVPTWAISSLLETGLAMLLQLFDRRLDGLLDAAADGHRVAAGGDVAAGLP